MYSSKGTRRCASWRLKLGLVTYLFLLTNTLALAWLTTAHQGAHQRGGLEHAQLGPGRQRLRYASHAHDLEIERGTLCEHSLRNPWSFRTLN